MALKRSRSRNGSHSRGQGRLCQQLRPLLTWCAIQGMHVGAEQTAPLICNAITCMHAVVILHAG